jgi:hypothetical protein
MASSFYAVVMGKRRTYVCVKDVCGSYHQHIIYLIVVTSVRRIIL